MKTFIKAGFRRSMNTTTVREQIPASPRSHHKEANLGRVRTCHCCHLEQDIPTHPHLLAIPVHFTICFSLIKKKCKLDLKEIFCDEIELASAAQRHSLAPETSCRACPALAGLRITGPSKDPDAKRGRRSRVKFDIDYVASH